MAALSALKDALQQNHLGANANPSVSNFVYVNEAYLLFPPLGNWRRISPIGATSRTPKTTLLAPSGAH